MKKASRSKTRKRGKDLHCYEKLLNRVCTAFKLGWTSEETSIPGIISMFVVRLVPMHPSKLLGGCCCLEKQCKDGSWESASSFVGFTLEDAFRAVLDAFIENDTLLCLPRRSSRKNLSLNLRSEDIHMLDSLDRIEIQLDLLGL